MKRTVLFLIVGALALFGSQSKSFADSSSAQGGSDLVSVVSSEDEDGEDEDEEDGEALFQRIKQQTLKRLWKEVNNILTNDDDNDDETAIPKLKEILKLDANSQKAQKLLNLLDPTYQPIRPNPPIPNPDPNSIQRIKQTSNWTEGKKAGERKVVKVKGVEFAFRWCPAGTYMMGMTKHRDYYVDSKIRDKNATPHRVTLSKGFWMMETEVTQKQWKAIMGHNPSHFSGYDLPVEQVTWFDCMEFCKKCASLGLPVRLPTEAQWEYACRAGTTGWYGGPLSKIAWCDNMMKHDSENDPDYYPTPDSPIFDPIPPIDIDDSYPDPYYYDQDFDDIYDPFGSNDHDFYDHGFSNVSKSLSCAFNDGLINNPAYGGIVCDVNLDPELRKELYGSGVPDATPYDSSVYGSGIPDSSPYDSSIYGGGWDSDDDIDLDYPYVDNSAQRLMKENEEATKSTHPVGTKKPNAWGLYDMHGNVYEWCLDWYRPFSYGSVTDPFGPIRGQYRVFRGGCYYSVIWGCTSASRFHDNPNAKYKCVGFRCICQ